MISMDGSDHLHNVGSITTYLGINEPSPVVNNRAITLVHVGMVWAGTCLFTCDAKIDLQFFDIAVPQCIMVKWLARHNL
ncbi:hypothetical protein N7501_010860 [Penicillium viridicatum]|nr:hypothetical protein N7501_010860 [Penicillium viridicatum]